MIRSETNILNKKALLNVLYLLITIYVVVYIYLGWKERQDSLKEVVYVRVKIKKVELGNKGGPIFFFEYDLNDKLYEGNYTIINGSELKENKPLRKFVSDYFYVKVSRTNPKYNELLIEYNVSDTTLKQPENGWRELPEKIKSKYINQNTDIFSAI